MAIRGYPRDFFQVNKILQKITGFWIPEEDVHLVLRNIYFLYVALTYAFSIVFLACEVIILRDTIKDLNKFIRQFGMLFTHVVGILKFYILAFRRKNVRRIMDALQDGKYFYEGLGDFQPGRMMVKAKLVTSVVSVGSDYSMFKNYSRDFFYVNKILQRITGFWIPGNEIHLTLRILYFLYVTFIYALGIAFLVCEFIIFQDTIRDLNKFIRQFGMLFTHVVGVLKVYILAFRAKNIKYIMSTLQDKEYLYTGLGQFQPHRMMFEAKLVTSVVSVGFLVLYNFAGMSAHISSTLTINREVNGSHLPDNLTCYDFLPYYFYIPFNVETKGQCQHAFVFMHVGLDIFAWIIGTHDGVFVTLMNGLKTQLEIVQGAFRTIRGRCLKKLDLPADYKVFLDEDNPELERTLYAELTHCTKHLNILLQVRDDLESIFTYVTLAQTLACLIIFASCLYVASTVAMDSPEFFAQVEYFFCILVQLSMICFFGNEITVASAQIGISLYECDWFSSSLRFKRSMILTMCRIQRPVYVSIGKFSPLTLATLVAVCRGSFSYFALFKNVQ